MPVDSSQYGGKLIAHWAMDGSCRDAVGTRHGTGHDIAFVEGADGRPSGAALFDGIDDWVAVPHGPALDLGTRPFTITAWVKPGRGVSGPAGQILGQFDQAARRGANLWLAASSPGYSSIGDTRHVHFGIDDAGPCDWQDCGKPWPSNTLIGTLTAYRGRLYAGIADASDPRDACHVFRYAGGREWEDCGRVGDELRTPTVQSMIVHEGKLYAGTGVWDWDRAWAGDCGPTHVYVYEGGTKWRDCGRFGEGYRVLALASFRGDLYASDDTGKCYRYGGRGRWECCGQAGEDTRLYSLTVHAGSLYGGTTGNMYRYDGGTTWTRVGAGPFGTTQVHTLEAYEGSLYAGTWPYGKVLRYGGGEDWLDCGQMGIATEQFQINEVNELTVYNGKLYAGVIPKAEVYRCDGPGNWALLRQLVPTTPEWSPQDLASWTRVPCLTVFGGRLYAGTSTCHGRADERPPAEVGRVYAMRAGQCVSYDRDIGCDWTHIAAVRGSDTLRLYIDGRLRSVSPAFAGSAYDVTSGLPMRIGCGAGGYFRGALDDLRLYAGALSAGDVRKLARR